MDTTEIFAKTVICQTLFQACIYPYETHVDIIIIH